MSNLRTEIAGTMNLAATASCCGGQSDGVIFLGGAGDDAIFVNGQENIVLGEQGDDSVAIFGDYNAVLDDNGQNQIVSCGNANTIAVENSHNYIYSEGDYNQIMGNNGNQSIEFHGNNNLVSAGNGNHSILFTGDCNYTGFGNGNTTTYFFGNGNRIKGGDGNHTVKTLDWLLEDSQFEQYADLVESYADVNETKTLINSTPIEPIVEEGIATGEEGVGSAEIKDDSSSSSEQSVDVKKTAEYTQNNYTKESLLGMLSDTERAAAEKLDLTEEYNGSNRYVFAKGSEDGKVHVYDMKTNDKGGRGKCIVSVKSGNNWLKLNGATPARLADGVAVCFKGEEVKLTTVTNTNTTKTVNTKVSSGHYDDLVKYNETIQARKTTTGTIDEYQVITDYNFGHIYNSISLGNGTHEVLYTGSGGISAQEKSEFAKNGSKYTIRGGFQLENYTKERNLKTDVLYYIDNTKIHDQKKEDIDETISNELYNKIKTESPLILDFNKDGKVSAQAGIGVDLDNNGKADGAATNGDKMLAMSDMNSNGKIDGSEVFGDKTVNPFTGKKINAANGFEALKEVAKSAYEKTGIRCLNNGNVDLQALKAALALIGIKLGFISDDNVTELEDLAHVKSINVENYTQQKQTGDVQHNQLGSYTSSDGKTYKTDDVWFKLS